MPASASCSFRSLEECALHFWLRRHRLRHLHLRQEHKNFDPPPFRGKLKPPDFLLHLKPSGVVAVEAKTSQTRDSGDCYVLPIKEIGDSWSFERVSGILVWYAILSGGGERTTWSWIKLQDVVTEGIEVGCESMVVPMKHFVQVETETDLERLFQHIPLARNVK